MARELREAARRLERAAQFPLLAAVGVRFELTAFGLLLHRRRRGGSLQSVRAKMWCLCFRS